MGLFLCASAGSDINLLGGGHGNFDPGVDLLLLGDGGLALDVGDDDGGDDHCNQGKCGFDDDSNDQILTRRPYLFSLFPPAGQKQDGYSSSTIIQLRYKITANSVKQNSTANR